MRCTVVTKKGAQCKRQAAGGSQTCGKHDAMARREEERAFYLARMSMEDQAALPMADRMEGVDAETAALRVLMRRAVGEGQLNAFRLALLALVRTLRTKRELERQAPSTFSTALDRVLDELDRVDPLP